MTSIKTNWVKDFHDALFSPRKEEVDLDKAGLIRERNMPSNFFKYAPPSKRDEDNNFLRWRSLENLENSHIYLQSADQFNDPFELSPGCDEEYLLDAITPVLCAEMESLKIKAGIGFDCSKLSPQEIINILEALCPEVDICKRFEGTVSAIHNGLQHLARSKPRLTCFTSSGYQHQLMWAHYADSHKGFCAQYSTEQLKSFGVLDRFYPVLYSKDRFKFPKELEALYSSGMLNEYFISSLLLRKSNCWAYEEEWRLIQYSPETNLVKFPAPEIIYCGINMSRLDRELVEKYCSRVGIECVSMKINHYEYSLERSL